ncbi:uncharacterized protein LOC108484966 [Gossypium arboreum]|uniref:uncharacterized protein LOC108484966 n=1 Tax=Gossypium arboreum TaxID=29729 RepID=UPI0008193386|nr:uncharacterized protein LOC108484966 [Gossypium arboreum]
MVDTGNDNDDSACPTSFGPVNIQAQPSRVSVNVKPLYQTGTSALVNFPMGSCSNPGDNMENPTVPDFDEVEGEKVRAELSKQLEDRCKWIEEKFKELESADHYCKVDAKELSLVLDLVLPPKFKMLEFERYNRTSCPEAHITMFCQRMTRYVNYDQLLIHYFQDSLTGAAAKWYNQLSRAQVKSWKDLAQAFMKQYGHVTDIAPDRITLQNMEKRSGESFRKYAQRWREVTTQVQPPLLEKETTMLFINTLKVLFINHMLGSATKSFADIVMFGEMIKNAIRCGKIETGESTRRSAPKKKENKVSNVSSGYSKPVIVNQSRTVVTGQQASPRQEPSTRRDTEKIQRTVGHSIKSCISFKKLVEKLINMGVVKFDDALVVGNPLLNHTDGRVNAVIENVGRRVKLNADEVKTLFREVWKKMLEVGLITQSSRSNSREVRDYCEFHCEKGHEIQSCKKFRALVQGLIDNEELEFFEFTREEDVCASEEKSIEKGCEASHPVVLISRPKISEAEARVAPIIVIQKPKAFHFKDSKKVPWNYNSSVTVSEKESLVDTLSTEDEPVKKKSFVIRQGERMTEPLVN